MRKFLFLILFFFGTFTKAADKLPPPPSGYSWQKLTSIKSFVLKPDGWFFKQTKKGTTEGFFITRENIEETGTFKTGLTLNCIHDIPKKMSQLPSEYARKISESAATKHSLVEKTSSKQGPFAALRFRYIDALAGKESITVLHLLIANDKTGTLFFVIFEAPTATWDDAEKKSHEILKKLLLDDEI